jgi:hypothetical protein
MRAVCASFLCISQVRAASWCLLLLLLVPSTFPMQAELPGHRSCSNIRTLNARIQYKCRSWACASSRHSQHVAGDTPVTCCPTNCPCCPAPLRHPLRCYFNPQEALSSPKEVPDKSQTSAAAPLQALPLQAHRTSAQPHPDKPSFKAPAIPAGRKCPTDASQTTPAVPIRAVNLPGECLAAPALHCIALHVHASHAAPPRALRPPQGPMMSVHPAHKPIRVLHSSRWQFHTLNRL